MSSHSNSSMGQIMKPPTVVTFFIQKWSLKGIPIGHLRCRSMNDPLFPASWESLGAPSRRERGNHRFHGIWLGQAGQLGCEPWFRLLHRQPSSGTLSRKANCGITLGGFTHPKRYPRFPTWLIHNVYLATHRCFDDTTEFALIVIIDHSLDDPLDNSCVSDSLIIWFRRCLGRFCGVCHRGCGRSRLS